MVWFQAFLPPTKNGEQLYVKAVSNDINVYL